MTKQFHWCVFVYNSAADRIEPYNIFSHPGWRRDVIELCNSKLRKRDFCEALRRITLTHFWSKCEWEVVVRGWLESISDTGCKMDVYDQLKVNAEHLCEYVWRWRKEIAKL